MGIIVASFPVGHPAFVGVVMDHSVEVVASLVAILRIGAVYVPVEPLFPVERIRLMMHESHIDSVI